MPTKPYWDIPILESNEPLVSMPTDAFIYANPHPYAVLGAPYGEVSPYFVREGVLSALIQAQQMLQLQQPHWKLFIFDAYRPVAVQKFMVERTFSELLQARELDLFHLSASQIDTLWEEVYQLWAPPNLDPKTPPPHSTGAAVDITLFDMQTHQTVCMGSPIDELSVRSQPNYFSNLAQDPNTAKEERVTAALAHQHRQILCTVMERAGFQRHPGEWWHFSVGDQLWAWQCQQAALEKSTTEKSTTQRWTARYGRVV
jgi:zinc D-Ala-D-Ala dipeptidase